MNSNINSQAKPAKKLTLNKETVRLLDSQPLLCEQFLHTNFCSTRFHCTIDC